MVDFQNGLNDERVAAVAGKHRTGLRHHLGAGMYDPGHAMRTDTGTVSFKIGEHDGRVTERAKALAEPRISSVGIHLGAECIMAGRAPGHEVELIYGIPAQRFVDAYQGRDLPELLADVADVACTRGGRRPSLLQDVIRGRTSTARCASTAGGWA